MAQVKSYHLRVHHLLCSVLFEGKGYSEEFVKNMTHIVEGIKGRNEILLVTEPDLICESCPHKTKFNQCSLDDNQVEGKDERLLKTLQLEIQKSYNAYELFNLVRSNITKEIFEESCSSCQWKRQGICSYEKYVTNCNLLIQGLDEK